MSDSFWDKSPNLKGQQPTFDTLPELARWALANQGNPRRIHLITALSALKQKDMLGATVSSLMLNPFTGFLIESLSDEGLKPLEVRTILGALIARAAWHKEGRKYYEVSAGLGEMLAHTELRGLTGADIDMPYPAVYVEIPVSAGLQVDHPKTGEPLAITGGYVLVGHTSTGKRHFIFLIHSDNNSAVLTFSLMLGDTDRLEDAIAELKTWQAAEQKEVAANRYRYLSDGSDFDRGSWPKACTWLVNVLLYLSSIGAELHGYEANKERRDLTARLQAAKGTKRESIKARLRSLDPEYRYRVGASIRATEVRAAVSSREGSPLMVRTRVKGHWRHVAHGVGRTERRRTWILPFWRGPEDAPISNPIRKIV